MSLTDHLEQSDAEKETARLLESYLGPEEATQDIDRLIKACAACHGEKGIARTALTPNLAGQNQIYLLSSLRAYKSGTRKDEQMNALTRDLSDDMLNQLATHYAAITREK